MTVLGSLRIKAMYQLRHANVLVADDSQLRARLL